MSDLDFLDRGEEGMPWDKKRETAHASSPLDAFFSLISLTVRRQNAFCRGAEYILSRDRDVPKVQTASAGHTTPPRM